MKKVVMTLLIAIAATTIEAQEANSVSARTSGTVSLRLDVCYQKTSNLIFPSPIKSVDRGSEDILVQKPVGVENVLKVKAAHRDFTETNLSVITADGQFYSFNVDYNPAPSTMVIQVGPMTGMAPAPSSKSSAPLAEFANTSDNLRLINSLAATASISRRNIKKVRVKDYEMEAALRGLYTANDLFFYKLIVSNHSAVDYNTEAIRFLIVDKKKVKRTASQEINIDPIAIIGNYKTIKANSVQPIIICLPKQTIASDKYLDIELSEYSGGRNLTCRLDNKVLLEAMHIMPITNLKNAPYISAAQ